MSHIEPIAVRAAQPADLEPMTELLGELFNLEADFTAEPAAQRRGLRLLMDDPNGSCVLVADVAGQVIGMVTVQVLVSTAEGGRVGLLEDLVVRDGWRRQGAGTALLDAAEHWAREHGLLRLQLLADRDNLTGLEFYGARDWYVTQLVCVRRAARGGRSR
jgi:GNAT superfamily N-acetyltransferase